MRALVKSTPTFGLKMEEVPQPTIQDDEVLIKIKSTAICGTDLHIYRWDEWAQKSLTLPIIVGHEFVGEVVALGKNVSHISKGQRVSGEGHVTCGFCRNCRGPNRHLCPNAKGIGLQRNGAFADFLSLPATNVIQLPDTIPEDIAAIFDPLGNAVHTTLASDVVGEEILITGAGPVGLMAAVVAAKEGAKQIYITDVKEYRLQLAKTLGETHGFNIKIFNVPHTSFLEQIHNLGLNPCLTVGFEMSGSRDGLATQLQALYPGGNLALLGIHSQSFEVDWNQVILKGLTLQGIYGRKMFETWTKMIALLESGLDVSAIITHHFKAEEFAKAFEVLEEGSAGKILLHWD